MIFTITLNTGFDEVFVVPRVEHGRDSEVLFHQCVPSGKGINAARAVRALGGEVRALGFVGESDLGLFESLLSSEGLFGSFVAIPERSRRNLTLFERDLKQPAAHFRADGFEFKDPSLIDTLLKRLGQEVRSGDLVSLHGSTPTGLSSDTWARIATVAVDCGAKVLVDIYGEAFSVLLKEVPILACKPNEVESRVIQTTAAGPTRAGLLGALRTMQGHGIKYAFISMGAQGIAFLEKDHGWRAFCRAPKETVLVGAGDACMAAMTLLLSNGQPSSREIAQLMAAVGAAHVSGVKPEDLRTAAYELFSVVQIERL